jgi:hypothetical protein
MFKSTSEAGAKHHKTLLYAHHGWGKTYQFRFYQEAYGKGLILSGEGGLASLADVDIDYVEFKGWFPEHHPNLDRENNQLTMREIIKLIASDEFKAEGYNWIGIDSLTEMSDICMADVERNFEEKTDMRKWQDYERQMIGALKFIRDLPMEVLVTCLAKEEKNENDGTEYWPMVNQAKVAKKVPALFDHVFCGIKTTEDSGSGLISKRHVITDELRGWHGKTRDPRGKLDAIEEGGNLTELLKRVRDKS